MGPAGLTFIMVDESVLVAGTDPTPHHGESVLPPRAVPPRKSNRYPRRGRHAAPRSRRYAVASATCLAAIGASGLLLTGSVQAAGPLDAVAPPAALDRTAGTEVSRELDRAQALPASPLPSGLPSGASLPGMSLPGSASATPARPALPAGLDQAQTDNAAAIAVAARKRGLPRRAVVVALATAMQESNLHNLANPAVPESLRYPHQGVGGDHDSVGLFQQRPSQGWGTVGELMDPEHSAGLFLDRLAKVPGWESLSVTGAAQAVQRSAFPDAYQRHQPDAEQLAAALG
jgi:hypothetical protein